MTREQIARLREVDALLPRSWVAHEGQHGRSRHYVDVMAIDDAGIPVVICELPGVDAVDRQRSLAIALLRNALPDLLDAAAAALDATDRPANEGT
jgi:hypothetical protein